MIIHLLEFWQNRVRACVITYVTPLVPTRKGSHVTAEEKIPKEARESVRKTLNLMNDSYMSRFFDGQTECAQSVLRAILGIPDLTVVSASTQKRLTSLESHSAVLDVYARDAQGRAFNIELQNDPRGASPRRARYYSALIDSSILPKGEPYGRLPDSYVIFVADGDALRRGLPVCTCERSVAEDGSLLGDGSHIVFVDASYNYGNTPLGDVMHDFLCTDPKGMRCPALAKRARYYTETKKGVREMDELLKEIMEKYCGDELAEMRATGLAEGRAEGLAEGRAEGHAAAQRENIARMLADGSFAPEKIAAVLDVPIALVEEVAANL